MRLWFERCVISKGVKTGNTRRSDIGAVIVRDGELDLSHARYQGQPDGRKVVVL